MGLVFVRNPRDFVVEIEITVGIPIYAAFQTSSARLLSASKFILWVTIDVKDFV